MEKGQATHHHTPTLQPLLEPAKVAKLLGVRIDTLTVWRSQKRYPELKYIKVGSRVRYRLADVERFLESPTIGAVEG